MNLTVEISGSCDYLSFTAVHFAFGTQVTPPYELLGTSLEHTFATKLEKFN